MVFETSSGPATDLAGSRNRARSSSPLVKSLQGLSLSLAAVQEHGDDKALRASRLISASAALSLVSRLTAAYSLQKSLALAEFEAATFPSSESYVMTEDGADAGDLPSMVRMTAQTSAGVRSPWLSEMNSLQSLVFASLMVVWAAAAASW